MSTLPALFLDRLKRIMPPEKYEGCLESFSFDPPLTVRINTLKVAREELLEALRRLNISYSLIEGIPDGLELENISCRELQETEIFKKGWVYCQSLSSMLPALVLNPMSGERVLDMCAAPGSKTTQMAALMCNEGEIIALETIRGRYYKLKSVVEGQGAEIVSMRLIDGRRFRPRDSYHRSRKSMESAVKLFDKVLVDVPCSSEGRFKIQDPKTFAYWSPRKIEEMVRKQRGILLNASRWLKPGGTLVYSTCSFSVEENEGVLDWLLRKTGGILEVHPVSLKGVEHYPAILEWNKHKFVAQLKHCVRILPGQKMEGFFITKLKKVNGSPAG